MDFALLSRIFNRMLADSGLVYGGSAAIILGLLLVISILRRRKKVPTAKPADDIAMETISKDEPAKNESDDLNIVPADDIATFSLETDAPNNSEGESENDLDDMSDITIPRVGEAPSPEKSGFFNTSWLQGSSTPNTAGTSAAECERLAEIERKMMALRELYQAGLIAPEVYVVKAREFAAQID